MVWYGFSLAVIALDGHLSTRFGGNEAFCPLCVCLGSFML